MAKDISNDSVKLPPYDKKGRGTPVNGINPNKPPRFINICIKINVATPKHIYLLRMVVAVQESRKMRYKIKI